jgi:ergothioneine biosynthesis protein EgtB
MNAPHELHALNVPHLPHAPVLLSRFAAVRVHTMQLVAPLSAEDCCVQSMPDASPVKWHLAHTSWFFETFILERFESGFVPHHPAFRVLFNSYYNGIGERHLRAHRGLITRPSHAEVLEYRAAVDARIAALLSGLEAMDPTDAHAIARLVALGLQHEQQHQELIMTDVLHLLSMNPLQPAFANPAEARAIPKAAGLQWRWFEEGIVMIGHDEDDFCFDNEVPRHRQFVERFALASRLATNGEYRAFVEDGGYDEPLFWLSEGWEWARTNALAHPLYWQHDAGSGWQEFGLHGLRPLDAQATLSHVSFYEADAYARWAGARLPTEAEWESAVAADADADADGSERSLSQVFDTCWQWTASSYAPYPGYAPPAGALGEYNGKFMVNQYVLRGGSCATAAGHSRPTYRNFFPATARWQFSGIRLARSAGASASE